MPLLFQQQQQQQPPSLLFPVKWWNDFFHSRTQPMASFVLCGYVRMAYAILLLYDQFILSFDFDWFFLSGIMPCQQYYYRLLSSSSSQPQRPHYSAQHSILCTVLEHIPNPYIHTIYYSVFRLGIVNAILLLLGVAPKVQLLLLHVNMLSFHYHSSLIWDGEDVMFKVWNFLLLFLPLHTITIYDAFGLRRRTRNDTTVETATTTTWPMWPFRLWQIEICCIYIGAGYSKLSTDIWNSGNALYSIIHTKDFFGGPIVPEFIFNRRGPLHLFTWMSLVVECSSIILIWPLFTRNLTLIAIVLLHVGIDGAMNMHCFEWLSIIGWLFFLVQRQDDVEQQSDTNILQPPPKLTATTMDDTKIGTTSKSTASIAPTITNTTTKENRWIRFLLNIFLLTITTSFIFDATPFSNIATLVSYVGTGSAPSEFIESLLTTIDEFRHDVAMPYYYEPYLYRIGLYQGEWNLFTGNNDHNYRFEVSITYDNGTSIEHWSPDWGTMTWYEKKRWQRPMTFYENFDSSSTCKDSYATYYAKLYGPNVASVLITSHCEYPELEPPGNLFDMDYFFKPAKETLVRREPEKIFLLNYCDDTLYECDDYFRRGYCASDDDDILFKMVMHCRYSCQMCHNDADTLDVGNRIAVYFESDEEYFDGTVIEVKELHHVRQYLIRYDESDGNPEWTTSMSLRKQGVLILTEDETELNDRDGAADRTANNFKGDHYVEDIANVAVSEMPSSESYNDKEANNTADDTDIDEEEEEGNDEL